MTRRLMAGTGWKMNHTLAQTQAYAARLRELLHAVDHTDLDLFVLPPFTALQTAEAAFAETGVAIGAQNMHWEEAGAWTGEISAPMLKDVGCRYVALAHSERLRHFGETYDAVRLKLAAALCAGLKPILCLGETADEQSRAGEIVLAQMRTALADVAAEQMPDVVVAYEPRWTIGAAAAAPIAHVEAMHGLIREEIARAYGGEVAARARILHGGAVAPDTGPAIMRIADVDGLFVGRAAWRPEGFAEIVAIVAEAKRLKEAA